MIVFGVFENYYFDNDLTCNLCSLHLTRESAQRKLDLLSAEEPEVEYEILPMLVEE